MISSPRNRPAYKLPENIEAELILYDIVVDTFNKYFWGKTKYKTREEYATRNQALFNGEDLRKSYEMFKVEMNRNRDKGFRVDDSSYGFFSYLLRMCKL